MFRFADEGGCRHERLVGYFGEVVAPCGDACDCCSGRDPAGRAARGPAAAGGGTGGERAEGRGGGAGAGRAARRRRVVPDDGGGDPAEVEADLELFEALRAWRAGEARARGVPAYVVFPDATLLELSASRPRTEDDLAEVKGIGPKKLETYGAELLRILRGR